MKNQKPSNKLKFFLLLIISIFISSLSFAQNTNLKLSLIAKDINAPIFVTAPKGDKRLFIVQQDGVILVLENENIYQVLDISEKVKHSGEAGMLGLALHPKFLENGLAYVSYTRKKFGGKLTSVIEEYRFNEDKKSFDIGSAREIYTLKQPAGNHNGGMLAFGPEGYLYIGFGDGGGANDIFKNGQDINSALGSIIRINVEPKVSAPYLIPFDNAFLSSKAPENWVIGLRNPWRFSFDNDLLYIADVGQSGQEEITIIKAGAASSGTNLGWPLAEGDQCLFDKDCKNKDLIWPSLTYPTGDGCAITGGYVYRGEEIPDLNGHYFYADFCNGKIASFKYENEKISKQKDWSQVLGTVEALSSFGIDGFGELYVISLSGDIYRLENEK